MPTSFDMAAERAFVSRVMDRDPQALDELAHRIACVPRILAALNRRMGRPLDDDDLADAAGDAFVVILRRLPDYQPLKPLESWVYGICTRQLQEAIRRKHRSRRAHQLDAEEQPAPTTDTHPPALETAQFDHLLRGLGEFEARVLELKILEDWTFPEIAGLLRIPENTAKSMYYRAMARLRPTIASPRRQTEEP